MLRRVIIEVLCFCIVLAVILTQIGTWPDNVLVVILIIYAISTITVLCQTVGTCTNTLPLVSKSSNPWTDPNVLSNIALLVVGIALLTQPGITNLTLGASLVIVFFGSSAFHVTETVPGLNLDRAGMAFTIGAIAVTTFHIETKNPGIKPVEYVVSTLVALLGVLSCNLGKGRLWIMYRMALACFAIYVALHRRNWWLALSVGLAVGGDLLAIIRPVESWILHTCGFSGHACKHVFMALAILFLSFAFSKELRTLD